MNGLIFPGGLTDLYIDDPYVIAAKKLHTWAAETNDAGEVEYRVIACSHLRFQPSSLLQDSGQRFHAGPQCKQISASVTAGCDGRLSCVLCCGVQVMPIQGTCLGHQLLQILASNVNFTELLVPTDSVVSTLSRQP